MSLLPVDALTFETHSSGRMNVSPVTEIPIEGASDVTSGHGPAIAGLINNVVQGSVSGPIPQSRPLVKIKPKDKIDTEEDTVLGVARGTQ